MNSENTEKLWKTFPLLYAGRHLSIQENLMPFGFECGDGWFKLIWDLSEKLEPLIQKYLDENPHPDVCGCSHKRDLHSENSCSHIFEASRFIKESFPCKCSGFKVWHPKASQVKEKFASMRFYTDGSTDEMERLIDEAEKLSGITCETCGQPGTMRGIGWYSTLCDTCAVDRDGKVIPLTPDDYDSH